LLPNAVKYSLQHPTGIRISYSQEAEDLILDRFFEEKQNGFFVDIGAHHPIRFSNTYNFYLKGWRGINVDATPGSMNPFKKIRPEDINIEVGVSNIVGELTYHMFYESALNTFSQERVKYLLEKTPYKLEKKISVKTKTLANILDEYVPAKKQIDFLTIDVEGLDFEILKTNNWDKYKPTIILVEDLDGSIEKIVQSELYNYLKSYNYSAISRSYNTLFFKLNELKK
jgi:FkbM family methyltransferase